MADSEALDMLAKNADVSASSLADLANNDSVKQHIMAEVELICDSATVIHHGPVRASGTLDELRDRAGEGPLGESFLRLLGEDTGEAPS